MTWNLTDEERAAVLALANAAKGLREAREAAARYRGPPSGAAMKRLVEERLAALSAIDTAADELLNLWGNHGDDLAETVRAGGYDDGDPDGCPPGSGSDEDHA